MKTSRILLTALAVAPALAVATPASAQSATGVVDITGIVESKCIVANPGSPSGGASFGAAVDLGNLAATDGSLATDLASRFTSVGGANLEYRIICTSAKTNVSVDADPLVAASAAAEAGYANRIDYKATVSLALTGGTSIPVASDSTDAAATVSLLNASLAAAGDNVFVTAGDFRTLNLSDILRADTYSGKITIVISPAA